MATVYVGRHIHEDGTEQLVALKVIREELANDEQFAAMFVDEARILARLAHPNVIRTLEYGMTDRHRFIAMELLNGRTIADVWDVLVGQGERFDLGAAAWICARIAEGAHSAHELVDETGLPLGVIHRDVNPTNIFLTHTGDVKLIDFGLARARVRLSKSDDGIVKGKIPYLAPEQAEGKPIDRRIDIYALGATLWELSTMKRLFKRDNDVDTLRAIRDAHVPDPRHEDPDFPEALWRIIERALRRAREERYQTAEEMQADLDAFALPTAPHAGNLAALVSRLFPGGEARQARWLRDAAAVRQPGQTMAPPARIPIASSSLVQDASRPAASPVIVDPPVARPAPQSTSESKLAQKGENEAGRPNTSRSLTRASRSVEKGRHTSRRPQRRATTATVKARTAPKLRSSAPRVPLAEDQGQLVKIVVTAVVVLLLLALVASR